MKIAFFVHGYLPWDAYGVPRYVERLGSYLADRGHQIYVITVGRPNLPKFEKPKTNLTIYRTSYIDIPSKRLRPFWSSAFYTVSSLLEASRLVNKEGIQILHGHTVQWGGLQSILVSRLTAKPCIITIHGVGLDRYPKRQMPWYLRPFYWANVIICQKTSAARKLKSWGLPEKKLILLTGFVNTERFRPAENRSLKGLFVVSFVGRMTAFKGPQTLLEAVPYVLSKHPNTIFQFVGEGDLKEYLMRKAVSMDIVNHVKFLGFRTDVDEILRNSDVSVSLSPYENVSDFALLEAMATGVPVVATDVGETRTIVKDGEIGLLAKCNPIDIAEKIIRVMDDRALAYRLSRNEKELIVKDYSLDAFGRNHEEIYWNLIKEKTI